MTKLEFLKIRAYPQLKQQHKNSMLTSRLAISDLYKNGYLKQSKSVLLEANVLELDVRIDGLHIFPDHFFPD